ncbi:MAG: hypothetical protein Q9194_002083 [Teloschistes cf. exilis]
MPLWGGKLIGDAFTGKNNRRRQEDKQRRANAYAQGLTPRGYEMMAPFDIPISAANPVSYPPHRYPIPPHHSIEQRPHRGNVRQGHSIGPLPFQQPFHSFYPPHPHPVDRCPMHPEFRRGRRRRRFIDEELDNESADDNDQLDDDDDGEDDDDDDDDDPPPFSCYQDLLNHDRRSYTRDRRHRRPEHGNPLAYRDPRAIMAPHGHHHGMYGNPFAGQRGVYGGPYAMGGRQRGYSDTESTVTW